MKYNFIEGKYVRVTITSNEELQEIDEWELSKDKKTLTKTYQENKKETIEIKDTTGNITLVEINIDQIQDKNSNKDDEDKKPSDKIDNNTEPEKTPSDKIDNSTVPQIIPNAGITRPIVIGIVSLGILLVALMFKLRKYKDV